MTSQEDYLDRLLRGLMEDTEQTKEEGEDSDLPKEAPAREDDFVDAAPYEEPEAESPIQPEARQESEAEPEPQPEARQEPEAEPEIITVEANEADILTQETMFGQKRDEGETDPEEDIASDVLSTAEDDEGTIYVERLPEDETVTEQDRSMSDEMEELLGFMRGEISETENEAEDEPGGMSEEQIEQILRTNRMEDASDGEKTDEEDLMSLLGEGAEENDDLQDIHDMLQKSDNNEAVDEDLIAALQNLSDDTGTDDGKEDMLSLLENLEDDEEGELTPRQKKALEKKRLKEEKAAAKKAAREAKKAEKLAARQARNAAKNAAQSKDGTEEMAAPAANEDVVLGEAADVVIDPADADLIFGAGDLGGAGVNDPEKTDRNMGEDSSLDELFDPNLFADGSPEGGSPEDGLPVDGAENGEQKKKSFFARILDFLTEEDEDEEPERGTENIPMSDENRQVLDEMDQEELGKKGKKKKGKKNRQKGKNSGEEFEESEEEGGKGKKKPRKPKKVKEPKEKAPVEPGSRITLKKLMPVIVVSVSMILVIMLLINLGGDFLTKRQARKAFYEEDYKTCYQELYGRELNESEQVMFGKSESILRIRLWMREYELLADEGAETEALDVLIQSVNDYPALYEYAGRWNAHDEVGEVYSQMLGILQEKYGLTEAQALAIAAEPDDVVYTKLVTAAAQGEGYHPQTDPAGLEEQLPDMLPEEKDFPENNGGR